MELLVVIVFGITLASAIAIVMDRIDRFFGSSTLTKRDSVTIPPEVAKTVSGNLKSESSKS